MNVRQFVLDLDRCTGCEACSMACWMEHRGTQSQPWRRVHTYNAMHHPGLPVFHLSLACHHCDDPACLENCPARAITRNPGTGAVIVHGDRCMGCRYCTWACPHDAPRFDRARGVVEKCTFCEERQEQGLEPACVARCPVGALGIEPRTPFRGPTPPGFPVLAGLHPGIRILEKKRPLPRVTAPSAGGALTRALRALLGAHPASKITLRGEWSLVVFTSILAVLAGRMGAAALVRRPFTHPAIFLGAGGLALMLSAWHLGSPLRAWRAVLNVRHSWLSREVGLVFAFLVLCCLSFWTFPHSRGWVWSAALVGMAALFAVDRVYQVALQAGPSNFHSAHVLFNGLYLTGLMSGCWPLALAAGVLKGILYLRRKGLVDQRGRGLRLLLSALRVAVGFGVPALVFGGGTAVVAAILGDLVDRCEYYDELDITTPASTMVEDLRSCFEATPH